MQETPQQFFSTNVLRDSLHKSLSQREIKPYVSLKKSKCFVHPDLSVSQRWNMCFFQSELDAKDSHRLSLSVAVDCCCECECDSLGLK